MQGVWLISSVCVVMGAVVYGPRAVPWDKMWPKAAQAQGSAFVPLPRPKPAPPLVPPEVSHVPVGTRTLISVAKVGGTWLAVYDDNGTQTDARVTCPRVPRKGMRVEVEEVYIGGVRSLDEARCSRN